MANIVLATSLCYAFINNAAELVAYFKDNGQDGLHLVYSDDGFN
jgi:hypothetical protein